MENFGINQSSCDIINEINGMIEGKYKYQVGLKDGVSEFLAKCRHIRMCIATATDRYLVEYALKRLNIDEYFKFIITSAEVGSSKQSPDIYIKAAELLKLPICDIVVFEDALHAIESSKKAGFYTVGVHEAVFDKDMDKIIQKADCYVINLNEFEVGI